MTNWVFNELTNEVATIKYKNKNPIHCKSVLGNNIYALHMTLTSAYVEYKLFRGQIIIAFAKA